MSGARPTFFRALCMEATQGGNHSYRTPGYKLARCTAELLLQDHEETPQLAELHQALNDADESAIIVWYQRELPRCMALVPARRRSAFVKGVQACWEEGNMD